MIGVDCFSGKWFDQRAEELESKHKRVLDESHRWGKRPTLMRAEGETMRNRLTWVDVPCCLNCLVDGYEDEPAAFEPCRRQSQPAGG